MIFQTSTARGVPYLLFSNIGPLTFYSILEDNPLPGNHLLITNLHFTSGTFWQKACIGKVNLPYFKTGRDINDEIPEIRNK